MKQRSLAFWKTFGASALAGLLTVSVSAAVIQSVVSETSSALAPGVVYQYQDAVTERGAQKIHTVSFDLKQEMVEMRLGLGGNTVRGLSTVLNIAREADTDGRVIAAINGDFFSMGSSAGYVPYGMMIQDGELYTSPNQAVSPLNGYSSAAFSIDKEGNAFIGYRPDFQATMTVGEQVTVLSHINRLRAPGDSDNLTDSLVLYTDRYASSTCTTGGLEVTLQVEDDTIRGGGSMTGTVVSSSTAGNSPLEPGMVVLSATDKAKAPLEGLKEGDTVKLDFTFADSRWNDVSFSIGGAQILVEDGVMTVPSASLYNNPHPRTAVGIKADGSIVWLTVDGRQEEVSEGLTGAELAQLMIDMGCTWALNLDGGGSTTMVAKLPGEELTLRNVPSDNRARSVANCLLLLLREDAMAAMTTTTTTTTTQPTTTTTQPTTTTTATTTTTQPTTTTTATTTTTQPTTTTTATTTRTTAAPPPTRRSTRPASPEPTAVPVSAGTGNHGLGIGLVAGGAGLAVAAGAFVVLWSRGVFQRKD